MTNDINNQRDIFVYDRLEKITKLVTVTSDGTQANGLSLFSVISNDGNYIAYESTADNLVAGDTNGLGDIFLYDNLNQTTARINLAADGTQANGVSTLGSISDDGNYISFASDASNLVPNDNNGQRDIFVYDRLNNTVELVSQGDTLGNGDSLSLIHI